MPLPKSISLFIVPWLATIASAGTLSTFTSVEANIMAFGTYPSFSSSGSGSSTGYGSEEFYGYWLNHGELEYGWLGNYNVDLAAYARADYGDLGIYIRSISGGGGWQGRGVVTMETTVFAEAYFDDVLRVAQPGAGYVEFTFIQEGTVTTNGGERPCPIVDQAPSIYCSGGSVPMVLIFPVEPDGTVHLNVRLWMEVQRDIGYSIEADYLNSLRLVGTEVTCNACEPWHAPDQRLFSRNLYSGAPNIFLIPEPSTAWLVAIPIVLFAIRRSLTSQARSRISTQRPSVSASISSVTGLAR